LTGQSGVVVACSALKKYYRDILRGWKQVVSEADSLPEHLEPVHPDTLTTCFVFIKGTREVLTVVGTDGEEDWALYEARDVG
jgi:gluconokinase